MLKKKNVKGKEYYYLEKSIRLHDEVKTYSKYLGKKVPSNVSKLQDEFENEIKRKTLYVKLEQIKRKYKKEWSKLPESIKQKRVLQIASDFTYNTNAIENSKVTKKETEDLLERGISPNKPLNDVLETKNHAKVFFEMLNEKRELSLSLLKKWHYKIFKDSKNDIAGKIY